MPILKSIKNVGGQTLGYHIVKRVEFDPSAVHQVAVITVQSWPDDEAYVANLVDGVGCNPAWTWHPTLPLIQLSGEDMTGSIERALVVPSEPIGDNVFGGGSVASELTDIDTARSRQWARIKQTRNILEQGGFTWDGSTFDSDMLSSARWQATVGAAARAAAAADGTWSTPWKLADNTFRVLSSADVAAIDDTRFAYMRGLHIISNTLFEQINDPAKTTVAEIEGIVWPVGPGN